MRQRTKLCLMLISAVVLAGNQARASEAEKRRKLLHEIGIDKARSSTTTDNATPPANTQDTKTVDVKERDIPGVPGAPQKPGAAAPSQKSAMVPAPSFRRAIHPLLMTTCSVCHRAGGPAATTRLVLSGEPAVDHGAVSRLVTVRDPAASALLTKAGGQAHAGGALWPADSANHARVLAWIAKGARLDSAGPNEITEAAPAAVAVAAGTSAAGGAPAREPRGAARTGRGAPAAETPDVPVLVTPVPADESANRKGGDEIRGQTDNKPVPELPRVPAGVDFASVVHPILMAACSTCHRAGAPAGVTRFLLTGQAGADEATARTLVDVSAPARSPLITKAAGEMHGGGVVLATTDPRHATLLAWATPPIIRAASPAVPASGETSAAVAAHSVPVSASPAAAVVAVPSEHSHAHDGGIGLPFGFLLNGRFDLNYERRQFSGSPFDDSAINALRSYHHFLFLSRAEADDPCRLSLEVLTLQFWQADCRVLGPAPSRLVSVSISGGKLVVPFGADPLYHQSYGGLAGFDQRLVPVLWSTEGAAVHLVHRHADLTLTDDLFVVRGYTLTRADSVLNLQNDFAPVDQVRLGWGNRFGANWQELSAWYSAYVNPLGFGRRLFMQAFDLTISRPRSIPVLGHFSLGLGALRADVSGGDGDVGGVGKDYYHFGSYFQLRYHPTDWLFAQYRQGLRTFNNRRGVILDNSRLTSADGSTHSLGIVARHHGLTGGVFYFINLEKVAEIPDDLLRVSLTYDF